MSAILVPRAAMLETAAIWSASSACCIPTRKPRPRIGMGIIGRPVVSIATSRCQGEHALTSGCAFPAQAALPSTSRRLLQLHGFDLARSVARASGRPRDADTRPTALFAILVPRHAHMRPRCIRPRGLRRNRIARPPPRRMLRARTPMQRSSSKQRLHATIEIGRDINIAIWGAAVYCACVVRDSLVVGEAKPRLSADE
jgi:hypothetical protein